MKENRTLKSTIPSKQNKSSLKLYLAVFKTLVILTILTMTSTDSMAQSEKPFFSYSVDIKNPSSNVYGVTLHTSGWNQDIVQFKMPQWMPGYYQIMNYSDNVEDIIARNENGVKIPLKKINANTWEIKGIKNKKFSIAYNIKTSKQFVANSYVDSEHAYIIPASSFLYVEDFIDTPLTVMVTNSSSWDEIATGLELVPGKSNEFSSSDFDILYDSPFLIGNLEELSSFTVRDVHHRFIGYKMGDFDRNSFIQKLKLIVESVVDIIGDIPFKEYTFIAIGPGRGGIEHLNNTTISFDGSQLNSDESMNRMMNFLAHEYFHHYNVKRIRPLEVGPFDYDKGSKTNLLWVSEGLTVYYDNLIVKRAGLYSKDMILESFGNLINSFENNPGRHYQSLAQSSYNTWSEGPFGTQGDDKDKSISYYEKGPIIGLLIDFSIRNSTQNEKSLDSVMRFLYWEYYKKKQRGFTDAEFQQACETIAGKSMSSLFEYIYTTKDINYNTYLDYAGLYLEELGTEQEKRKFRIKQINNPTTLQTTILNSWLGNKS